MLIKNLFAAWRQNVALHATLTTREVIRIDHSTRDLVRMGNADSVKSQLKFQGTTEDGIEVYANIELIGSHNLLRQFQFEQGKHVGLVLRAID